MPKDSQIDPRKSFVLRYLPLFLGGVMFAVYAATLNHWITLANLNQVAAVSGLMWQPDIFNPLSFLVTLPFRLLPAAHIPILLNLFSAFCAAAALAVLARTVSILPHDRTELERTRERSDFSFLTGWIAWIPPIAAVLFAGLQLGFWENATSFTNNSFELLWFGVIVLQIFEYRLDEREGRLYLAAFMFGASLSEDWGMVGYIPVFITTIIWLRGLSFFNTHFLARMAAWGFAGLSVFLLLPFLTLFTEHGIFWEALKAGLHTDWVVLKLPFLRPDIRHDGALICLTTLLPAFVIAIRWSSTFGDSSRLGATLVNYLMHGVNAILLGVLVWLTFDPPFSPHRLLQGLGVPAPALTLYYIVALCIAYYSGYFLLIFSRAAVPTRRNPRPEPALPKALNWLCPVVFIGMLVCLTLGVALLAFKNRPQVLAINDDVLMKYARLATRDLPRDGAILLADSDDPAQDVPTHAGLVKALLVQEGNAGKYPVIDTAALNWPSYHAYLHKHFPKVWPQSVQTNSLGAVSALSIYTLLGDLSKSNTLCYLNPSFGYYFEQFYQEPHGLYYSMKPFQATSLLPPPLGKDVVAENDAFWTQTLADVKPTLDRDLHPPDVAGTNAILGWIMGHLHVTADPNPNATAAGMYYSRSLNDFGVQLQRGGELEKAADIFKTAIDLNPNNNVASINLAFNKTLREGTPTAVDQNRTTADQFGKYSNWNEVLTANGPFDETSFCFEHGVWLLQAGLTRQAAASFNRVKQLVPDNLAARLFLAQIYVLYKLPDNALDVLHDPLTRPFRFGLTEYNSTEVSVLAAAAHFLKNENAPAVTLLENEMNRHPDDETLLLVSAQAFNMRGLYSDALKVIDRKLARTPDDPNWVFGKGYVSLQVGDYGSAITNLSRILAVQSNNPSALFNRGVAYFRTGNLDAAQRDFRQFQSLYSNNLQVAFGLGEIAWRKHDTNEIKRNYQLILSNAPANAPELNSVRDRLNQVGGK